MEQKESFSPEYAIEGTIDRFEDTHAVIITQDNQTLLWPVKNLPNSAKEGVVIKLKLITGKAETQNQEQTVKNLLNQIIKK